MRRGFFIFQMVAAVCLALPSGCTDSGPLAPFDFNYFTVIHAVPPDSLAVLVTEFTSQNPRICSSLNEFGFTEGRCGGGVGVGDDRVQLEALARQELVRNKRFTGVEDASLTLMDVARSPMRARVRFENQRWQGIEVLSTSISVEMDSIGVLSIDGNHYDKIHVPPAPRISSRHAQRLLIGKEIGYSDWTGTHVHEVGWDSFWGDPVKVVLPRREGDVIEFRVAWSVSAFIWAIYVDAMTGEEVGVRQQVVF